MPKPLRKFTARQRRYRESQNFELLRLLFAANGRKIILGKSKKYNSEMVKKILAAAAGKPVASFKTIKEYHDWCDAL